MAVINRDFSTIRSLSESTEKRFNAHEAELIIDQLVEESISNGKELDKTYEVDRAGRKRVLSVRWPTIEEFTDEQIGLEKIVEYIEKDWRNAPNGPDPSWVYYVDFLEKKSMAFNDLYVYRVRYSTPTRREPVAKHSVSIYFTFDVSKTESKENPVKVVFVFETMRSVCHPEKFSFHRNWLEQIRHMKKILARGLDF